MWQTEVKTGTSIIEQGDRGDNLYVVESGSFDIFVKSGKTNRKVGLGAVVSRSGSSRSRSSFGLSFVFFVLGCHTGQWDVLWRIGVDVQRSTCCHSHGASSFGVAPGVQFAHMSGLPPSHRRPRMRCAGWWIVSVSGAFWPM